MVRLALLLAAVALTVLQGASGVFVPFNVENVSATSPVADILLLNGDPLELTSPRVVVDASTGHFVLGATGGPRVRFWGVNFCFTEIFVSHEKAVVVAERLQQAGVNIVRFHHGDADGVYPYSYWACRNCSTLSEDALDRMFFFIAELAKRGIYTNMNLHVNKRWSEYLALPGYDKFDNQDKLVPFLSHRVREMHRLFADDLLQRRNPYRGNATMLDDPAVAMVEISNENSLYMWSTDILDNLPPYFAAEAAANFSSWLVDKYTTNENLEAAWNPTHPDQCNGTLSSVDCAMAAAGAPNLLTTPLPEWNLEQHSGAAATVTEISSTSVRIEVTATGTESWYLQYNQRNIAVLDSLTYVLSFRARSLGANRPLSVSLSMAEGTYANLGLSGSYTLTSSWQTFKMAGPATQSFNNSRVSFSFASSSATFELADVVLAESVCDLANDNMRSWNEWSLSTFSGAAATLTRNNGGIGTAVVDITALGTANWHIMFGVGGLHIKAGVHYLVNFVASSTTPLLAQIAVTGGVKGGGTIYSSSCNITSADTACGFSFAATANTTSTFQVFLGTAVATVTLKQANIAEDGCTGLAAGESINNVAPWPALAFETRARWIDRQLFIAFLERNYWEEMRTHIKTTLGYKGLVTGTIQFGPIAMWGQADMDFIDDHSYWQHPSFPGIPWSSTDWYITQKPMSLYPTSATFWGLVRAEGRPFTVTEYNHAAPIDAQAEAVPMIAAWAALQDLDGIFLFAYSHGDHVFTSHKMNGFFDIDYNPAKWCFMKAASLIYQKALIPRNSAKRVIHVASSSSDISAVLTQLADKQGTGSTSLITSDWQGSTFQDWIRTRISLDYGLWQSSGDSSSATEEPGVFWNASVGFSAWSSAAVLFSGTNNATASAYEWGSAAITSPALYSLALVPLDAKPLAKSESLLFVAIGRVENTGMVWNAERTSVTNQWGTSPALAEVVEGTVTINGAGVAGDSCSWQPLNSSGVPTRTEALSLAADGSITINLVADDATVWYVLRCTRVSEPSSTGSADDNVSAAITALASFVVASSAAMMSSLML